MYSAFTLRQTAITGQGYLVASVPAHLDRRLCKEGPAMPIRSQRLPMRFEDWELLPSTRLEV